MGGIVDNGVDSDTKTSPRSAAIEKAQAELRQEYDAREEHRRELEFLENGGNPLDFKFSHGASISVQSTSATDQLAEQHVISEAKGSFAMAASPHGDSVESSGRPGGSVGKEPNTADNLLLFDRENNGNLDRQKNVKRSGKRGIAVALEHSSPLDGCPNVKESNDSVAFHFGVKSQAYVRRNRSRTTRDSTHAGSTNLIQGGNRSSIIPSSRSNSKDTKGPLQEAQVDDLVVSSISNTKPASPNGNIVSKTSGDQMDMEVDGVQSNQATKDMTKDGLPERVTESTTSQNLLGCDSDGQDAYLVAEQTCNGATSLSSGVVAKGAISGELVLVHPEKGVNDTGRGNDFNAPGKSAADLKDEVTNRKSHIGDATMKASDMIDIKIDHTPVQIGRKVDEATDDDQNLPASRIDGSPDRDHREHVLVDATCTTPDNDGMEEENKLMVVDGHHTRNSESGSALPNPSNLDSEKKDEGFCISRHDKKNEVKLLSSRDDTGTNAEVIPTPENNLNRLQANGTDSDKKDSINSSPVVMSNRELLDTITTKKDSSTPSEPDNGAPNQLKLTKKAQEDAILKEARIIEANLRRAGEVSTSVIFSEKQKKCHWDYVLEEMAWMANDFMQERIWKTTAASQVCNWIASSGLSKFWKENGFRKQQHVARTLSKAVLHFWHAAEVIRTNSLSSTGSCEGHTADLSGSLHVNEMEGEKHQEAKYVKEPSERVSLPVQGYAVRFLKYSSSISVDPVLPEAPTTPDRLCDTGILEMSLEDPLSEENLFYTVPSGAIRAYRESVESLWLHDKRTGNSVHQEDCEASVCDSVADTPLENTYEEDEGETGTYILPAALESGLSLKFNHKKKNFVQQKSCTAKLYEGGTSLSYEPGLESKMGNHPVMLNGKRPSGTFNVCSIPTKRIRSAARQRVVSGGIPVTSKTDVSSGDTSSYQDDQSSLHGGSQGRKNLEVDSTMDFERQLPYDSSEISTKSKKKKKPKHLGYKNSLNLMDSGVFVGSGKSFSYEQRLQVDPMVQHEPILKKRLDSPHFELNGNTGLYMQHVAKKPKLLKQPAETSPETITPITGSIPSPVASQMSNMPNPNKLFKIITNRERPKKTKGMKMVAGQSGSGSPWSAFEDQALVVLVHDMGPNWELVSDAMNSALHFKYIFRKPKECKARHKFLLDKSAGDGADSAEDSGSSQPYPSTLPGIPKGSARQLFQRLQEPIEEDTLTAHFEKIILIGQKLHSCRSQNNCQELKQIIPAHSSHVVALSQVTPNNLSGGVLTPLDICDAITSNPDIAALGYQGTQTSGLAIPNHQGSMAPVLPTSSASAMLQGSPRVILGNGLPSPSTPLSSAASRDGQRYAVPRPASLPVDDQQRIQQYSQMLSGRNVQQPGLSVPGALPVGVDRGVRMISGGNGMGMMCGMNRGMAMPRQGIQGINSHSPGMLNVVSTGTMLSGSVGMSNPGNVHPAAASGPGNSMLRPRDALHMMRPGQNTEDHRQMMMQELQMQVPQGNGQAVTPFSAMSGPFSNATVSPAQTFSVHQHQQPHQMSQQPHLPGNPHPHIQGSNHSSPQQQAYAMRIAKEGQFQQRILPQLQPSFSGSNTISPIQNSSQIHQQAQSSPAAPSAQAQQKQQQLPRNPQAGCGMPNQMMKPRQRPQVQQQPRNHQQQRQSPQQQAKVLKGLGRGTMLMHQNLTADASHVNTGASGSKNQIPEKHQMQQGQGFYSGSSGLHPSLSQPAAQKMFPRTMPQSSKQVSPMPSQLDSCNQGQGQLSSNHILVAPQQSPAQTSLPLTAQQQQQQQHQTSHPQQTAQRMMLPQNHQATSDGKTQPSADPVQVNQTPVTSIECADSVSSASMASSTTQWKPEPSYDTSTPTSSAQVASLPQETLVANEILVPSSSQASSQRQFHGAIPTNGQGIGGQWQQQQQPLSRQPQQPHPQHRQAAQDELFPQPSNSGLG